MPWSIHCAALPSILHSALRIAWSPITGRHGDFQCRSVHTLNLLILLRHHLKITLPFGVLAAGTAELNVYFFGPIVQMSRPCVERSGSDRKHGKQAAMVSSGPHKGCLLL